MIVVPKPFEIEGFSFFRITPQSPDFSEFCDFFTHSIVSHTKQAQGDKTPEEIAQGVREGETKLGSSGILVICKHLGKIVGCVRIAIDTEHAHIPTESHIGVSFDKLRSQGNIMEISRLAIAQEYRRNPVILDGLFTWCNNAALANDIDFVLATGFSYVVPLYKRLAFELFYPKGHQKYSIKMPNGFIMHPLILNFSDLVLNKNLIYQQNLVAIHLQINI